MLLSSHTLRLQDLLLQDAVVDQRRSRVHLQNRRPELHRRVRQRAFLVRAGDEHVCLAHRDRGDSSRDIHPADGAGNADDVEPGHEGHERAGWDGRCGGEHRC